MRAKLREKRQVSARARRYYDEYELRMRARMLKRQTREEQVRKLLFENRPRNSEFNPACRTTPASLFFFPVDLQEVVS